jgi:predicted nucleic acid-binding protein
VIYLLDTNTVSDLMRADRAAEDWIARLPKGRRQSELEENGTRFLSAFRCEVVPEQAAALYAELKMTRQQNGSSLDENDLWIAATALAIGATLVSRDRDFAEIPELTVVAFR